MSGGGTPWPMRWHPSVDLELEPPDAELLMPATSKARWQAAYINAGSSRHNDRRCHD